MKSVLTLSFCLLFSLIAAAQNCAGVSIAASASTICTDSLVSFTATPLNGGTTPVYQWLVNGQPVSGSNGPVFISNNLGNGDLVSCLLTSNAACATSSVQSSSIAMVVLTSVLPYVGVTPVAETVCAGSPASFTATPLNEGTAPVYQWLVNGQPVSGVSGPEFVSNGLGNGDEVSCQLTSSVFCAQKPIQSNIVSLSVLPLVTPGVSIQADTTVICAGLPVSFTATPSNGGPTPVYQWLVNGVAVSGALGPQVKSSSLVNGDQLSCQMTSDAACATPATVLSNTVAVAVFPQVTPAVSIVASANSVCADSLISFTATPTNAGMTPAYQWMVNGKPVGSDSAGFSAVLANGDVVSVALTGSLPCSSPPVSSNNINMNLFAVPTIRLTPDTLIERGTTIRLEPQISGSANYYQWTPGEGLTGTFTADPLAKPTGTVTYTLTVVGPDGCSASAKETVEVFYDLVMPTAFTPNGDGRNDFFRVPPGMPVTVIQFAIYDRLGAQVFAGAGSNAAWDGTSGGKPQPVGTYVWMMEYYNPLLKKTETQKGVVELIR